MGGLIVMFAAVCLVPLVMWTNARTRLLAVHALVRGQPWPVVRSYTAGDRGYVAMRIADRLVTLSMGKEASTPPLLVRVDLPAPGLPHFDVALRTVPFAGDTILLGHKTFDQLFRVKTREPDATRALWTATMCDRLRHELPGASVRTDAEALILGVHPQDPGVDAVRAVKLALDLACADVYGLGALRSLPDATLRITDGGLEIELPGASPIRLAPLRTPDGVVTIASVDEGVLPERRPDLTALGASTIEAHGARVVITWPAIEQDRGRLLAAVELLRTLSGAPHEGAYR